MFQTYLNDLFEKRLQNWKDLFLINTLVIYFFVYETYIQEKLRQHYQGQLFKYKQLLNLLLSIRPGITFKIIKS